MLILIKGTPELDICRDGGSVTAHYRTFWGNEHLLTLPVKWGKDQDGSLAPIGYGTPMLAKYKKSVTIESKISLRQALTIAKKILELTHDKNQEEMASVLVQEIERQCKELT